MNQPTTNMQSRTLSILQINLRHSKAASLVLAKTVLNYKVDVVMAQEPYAAQEETLEPMEIPPGFIAHHRLSGDHRYGPMVPSSFKFS